MKTGSIFCFPKSADVSLTKSRSGQSVRATNFGEDVTLDDALNSADVQVVRSHKGTVLP
jgi:hypothetical protein